MTLEEEINQIRVPPFLVASGVTPISIGNFLPIEEWTSEAEKDHNTIVSILDDTTVITKADVIRSLKPEVNKIIKKASLVECLTSPSEYIRIYKRQMEEKDG